MPRTFGGSGVLLDLQGAPTNEITLPAGACYYPLNNVNPRVAGQNVGNGGRVEVKLGRYSNIQVYDPIAQFWRGIGDDSNAQRQLRFDGANWRIANQSGCTVGAVITNAGTGYTSAPTVTAAAGSSVWRAVLGPYVTSVTVGSGGESYVYPPIVVISAPPAGGVQASAISALTAGAVSSVTVTNQGAGYSAGAPAVRLVNDIRDTTGVGATATANITGSGTVAAVICTDHGIPITSGTIPALTFSGGGGASAAATALMNWGVTTYAAGTPGAGYGNSSYVELTAIGPSDAAATRTNPATETQLVRLRRAWIFVPTNSTGGLITTGSKIVDGGVYQGVPVPMWGGGAPAPTTVGVITLTMGGFTDTSYLQPS